LLFPTSTAQMRKRTQFEQKLWTNTTNALQQGSHTLIKIVYVSA
jgi:hypothetical protein